MTEDDPKDGRDAEPGFAAMAARHAARAAVPFILTFAAAAAVLVIVRMFGVGGEIYDRITAGVVIIASLFVSAWIATRDGAPD